MREMGWAVRSEKVGDRDKKVCFSSKTKVSTGAFLYSRLMIIAPYMTDDVTDPDF